MRYILHFRLAEINVSNNETLGNTVNNFCGYQSTIEITFVIRSSGNKDGRPHFLFSLDFRWVFTLIIFGNLKKVLKDMREKYIPWENWNNFCGLRKFWHKLQNEVPAKITTYTRYNKFRETISKIFKLWGEVNKCKNGNHFFHNRESK